MVLIDAIGQLYDRAGIASADARFGADDEVVDAAPSFAFARRRASADESRLLPALHRKRLR